tara:strand:- start:4390 stop:5598 length:1209 start_codon:yes stop_codon:yes gene_type:complete
MKIKFLICLLSLGIFAFGQNDQEFRKDYEIPSEAFNDIRKISVYLPSDYYNYPDQQYTLTFVLDGQSDLFMDLLVKTIDYNVHMYNFTPTIVIGIHAKERGWEFSAPLEGEDESDYKGGRANELQQHFRNEVFPFIDSAFDRILDFKSLIGHSSGGHFVLYTLFGENSDLFDAYIGISPALRPGENEILKIAEKSLKNKASLAKFLYCSTGTIGEREELFAGAMDQLDSLLLSHPNHGILWNRQTFRDLDHFTCVGPSVNDAMMKLTRAFRADEKQILEMALEGGSLKKQLNDFYNNKEKNYGFSEIPVAGYIHYCALELMRKGKMESALELYEWGIEKHPSNYTLRKSKGKLYVKMEDDKEALSSFMEALEVLKKIKENVPKDWYEQQFEYINQKIKSLKE